MLFNETFFKCDDVSVVRIVIINSTYFINIVLELCDGKSLWFLLHDGVALWLCWFMMEIPGPIENYLYSWTFFHSVLCPDDLAFYSFKEYFPVDQFICIIVYCVMFAVHRHVHESILYHFLCISFYNISSLMYSGLFVLFFQCLGLNNSLLHR